MPANDDSSQISHLIPDGPLYIGEGACEKVGCPFKKEFPKSSDRYCIHHSLDAWYSEEHNA